MRHSYHESTKNDVSHGKVERGFIALLYAVCGSYCGLLLHSRLSAEPDVAWEVNRDDKPHTSSHNLPQHSVHVSWGYHEELPAGVFR